jgi:beta-galactosidase
LLSDAKLVKRFDQAIAEAAYEDQAMQQLYRVWGFETAIDEAHCDSAERANLGCIQGQASLDEIIKLNYPVVARLTEENGPDLYAVVLHVADGQADLLLGSEKWQVSQEWLSKAWGQDYTVLWQLPESSNKIISKRSGPADVLCLETVVDSLTEQFGIRSLEFSPEFGFKLNGKKIFLQGNANHHDLGALGAASYDKAIERMMLQLKSFGYNCIRCSHNPYSDSFARIADRVGMLVVDELTDKWSDNDYWGGRQPFTHIWHKLITEWIKRDRNRPSIILWSLGNELQIREGWAGFEGTNDWGITTYNIFNQLVKRWDNTRLTTVAMFPARAGAITRHDKEFNDYLVPPELACATEVASFNYQSDKYDAYLKYKPDLILFQSEAETSNLLQPYYNMDRKRTVGMAYWGSAEYWGESNKWPKKGWNYSFFDHTMRPYPQAYLIKSAFMPEIPEVHIGVVDAAGAESVSWNDVIVGRMALNECWNHTPGSRQSLFTFTNAHSVELLVNGQSMGVQENDTTQANLRNMIYWKDVPYGNGGSVVAIARDKSGKEVARHRIETAGKAVALRIEAETPTDWKADGMDLQYINVTAIDKKGRPVWDYNEPLTLQMEGAARLVALDNGDHYTDELFHGITSKRMYQGRMQIILRSDQEAGNVTVKISSAGLKGTLRLKTIKE